MYFDEIDFEDEVLDALDAMNFVEMTPVQEQTIPVIMQGRDVISCAQTGTGKTAAYILPLIKKREKIIKLRLTFILMIYLIIYL